jgi:hypothetical protein
MDILGLALALFILFYLLSGTSRDSRSRTKSTKFESNPVGFEPNPLHDPNDDYTGGPFGAIPNQPLNTYDIHSWHETGELASGKKWGRMGAMKYLINEKGQPITKRYHEFLDPEGERAELGATKGPVEFITPSQRYRNKNETKKLDRVDEMKKLKSE